MITLKDLKFEKINSISTGAEIELWNGNFLLITKTTLGRRYNFMCFRADKDRNIEKPCDLLNTEKEVEKWIKNNQPKKEKMLVTFSGGRTSAYMCWWLINNKSKEYDFTFVYANTSREHPNTLRFINDCDTYFNLNLIWLEADIKDGKNVGTEYKITNYKDCKKDGEIYEDMIKKYGLPNKSYPHCTRELKLRPIDKYSKELGITKRAIGIRADEAKRVAKNFEDKEIYYPLLFDNPVDKKDIIWWWSKRTFDLEITEELGNCVTCWKKSDRKLMTIAKNNPKEFDFDLKMDLKYGKFTPKGQRVEEKRCSFRNYQNTEDILNRAKNEKFKKFRDTRDEDILFYLGNIDTEESCNECGTVF